MDIRPVVKTPAPGASSAEAANAAPAQKHASSFAIDVAAGARIAADHPAPAGDDVRRAVEHLNAFFSGSQGIEFAIDDDSKRVIVKVVDRETREVLRQMPSQEALDIAKALDRTRGTLIKLEA